MQSREKILAMSPAAAVKLLTSRIKPVRLGRRVAEQVESSDYRGATILCRRALGAGRALPPAWKPKSLAGDDEQRDWFRQLLSLVDGLRVEQRRGGSRSAG